jgi:hypothetical protein
MSTALAVGNHLTERYTNRLACVTLDGIVHRPYELEANQAGKRR